MLKALFTITGVLKLACSIILFKISYNNLLDYKAYLCLFQLVTVYPSVTFEDNRFLYTAAYTLETLISCATNSHLLFVPRGTH